MTGGATRAAAQAGPEASGKVLGPIHAAPAVTSPLQASRAHVAAAVCPAVAVALCLLELDHLRAMEILPTPEALLDRLRARAADFDLLAGVASAYLHERGIVGAREVR